MSSGGGDLNGLVSSVCRVILPDTSFSVAIRLRVVKPDPRTAGYTLLLAAGTGVSVASALLPVYLSWWWLDTAGHLIGGATLALGLLILWSRLRTAVGVVILSLIWEAIEWTIGYPFLVTIADTQLDLLAGWIGLGIVLVGSGLRAFVATRTQA